MNIIQKPSPNYQPGRSQLITKVVLHWMDGTLASTDAVFANPDSQVSAHYGIENNIIHQYIQEGDTAWHAISANPYSIGIEHSAAPGRPASDETINTSAQLLREICQRHNIAINRGNVIPHSQVVNTQCPGTLPIDLIISKAQGEDMTPASYETANIYAQTILFRNMGEDEFNKYHKGKTRNELFDDFRVAPERAANLKKLMESDNKDLDAETLKLKEALKDFLK